MNDYRAQINTLRQALESQGYYPQQIKDIYRDCIGRTNIDSLSEEEAVSLIACLEEYVSFAQKCKHKR